MGADVGITVAGISMVLEFAYIPHFPIWSVVVIAVDVAIIWGLATYRPTPHDRLTWPSPSDSRQVGTKPLRRTPGPDVIRPKIKGCRARWDTAV